MRSSVRKASSIEIRQTGHTAAFWEKFVSSVPGWFCKNKNTRLLRLGAVVLFGGKVWQHCHFVGSRLCLPLTIAEKWSIKLKQKWRKFNALNYFDSVCLLVEVRVLSIVSRLICKVI